MLKISAPGKCILLGEHAVVYGHPALAVSIDLRLQVTISKQKSNLKYHILDGKLMKPENNPHIFSAINDIWGSNSDMLNINISSEIPASSGLGSSAALSVAITTGLLTSKEEEISLEKISSIAHKLEADAQGGLASPMDTSTSTHGGCILLANEKLGKSWLYSRNFKNKSWEIHSFELHDNIKNVSLVIGHTGIQGSTSKIVRGVSDRLKSNPQLIEDINAIKALTKMGVDAVKKGDVDALGAIMNLNHTHLQNIGVSCNELDNLVGVARKSAIGAKLTGAGGGGCIIALSRNPTQTARDIELAGGRSYICKFGVEGVKIEDNY